MSPVKRRTVAIVVVIIIAVALAAGYYYIRRRQQPTEQDATYPNGLKSVTMADEYQHNVPNMSEFWAPVYNFKSPAGVAYKWGGNFENARIESITKPDSQTIRIYGQGIEFILKPETGYRKVTISSPFLNSSLKDYIGWKPVKVGDVTEFQAYASKSVFWQNRAQPLTLAAVQGFMHYQVLGTVTLKRENQTYTGVGSFQHAWLNGDFYALQQSLGRQDAFHVYTDKFILFIQGGVYSGVDLTDGSVYFLDDGSYDVLGEYVKGYIYQVTDGPNRLSYHISAESHRGTIEIELTNPGDAQPINKGFQQANWAGVQATLAGQAVVGIVAASETIRQ